MVKLSNLLSYPCQSINGRLLLAAGIAIAIVVLLFGVQQFGTEFVGSLFSPIITLWLSSNAVIGIYNIAKYYPPIFKAISPTFWCASQRFACVTLPV